MGSMCGKQEEPPEEEIGAADEVPEDPADEEYHVTFAELETNTVFDVTHDGIQCSLTVNLKGVHVRAKDSGVTKDELHASFLALKSSWTCAEGSCEVRMTRPQGEIVLICPESANWKMSEAFKVCAVLTVYDAEASERFARRALWNKMRPPREGQEMDGTDVVPEIDPAYFEKDVQGRYVVPNFFGMRNPMLPDFAVDTELEALIALIDEGDDKGVMEHLTGRHPFELQQVRSKFEEQKGKSLVSAVEGMSMGEFENILVTCVMSPAELDVVQVHEAMHGLGTTEAVLIEILTSRTNEEIRNLCTMYREEHSKELSEAVAEEVSEELASVLTPLCSANREEVGWLDVDTSQASADAVTINSGEDFFAACVPIFTSRGSAYLHALSKAFEELAGVSLHDAIKDKVSGDQEDALLALLDPPRYLARLLKNAMAGVGTDDKALIRLLGTSRLDRQRMFAAKKIYRSENDIGLVDAVEGEASGAYKKALRRMCVTHPEAYYCVRLREAMLGLGTDEQEVMLILLEHAQEQRTRDNISRQYELDFGVTLVDAIRGEGSFFGGGWADALVAIVTPQTTFDAQSLYKSMHGAGTSESVLIDILANRLPEELEDIKKEYVALYEENLEQRIESEVRGNLEKILMALASGKRSTAEELDDGRDIADKLYDAGENKWGTDDDEFVRIFTTYSPKQLQHIDAYYQQAHGEDHGLTVVVKSETSGDYRDALIACVHPLLYSAMCVHSAIAGIGTSDWKLIRALMNRSPGEMTVMKRYYQKEYGQEMVDAVKGDTSGDYMDLLCQIIENDAGAQPQE